MPGIIDLLLVLVFGGVTYAVANEGAWSAILMALTVIFAGLFAMNFFEPTANFLEKTVGLTGEWSNRADFLALVGLFAAAVGLLRLMAYRLSPEEFVVNPAFEGAGGWVGGAITGWVTMAFLLTALHTAPLPREFAGFTPERKNFLNILAPDRQWLGFVQYCSERGFAYREQVIVDDPDNPGQTKPMIVNRAFDGAYMNVPGSTQTRWPSFAMRYATRRERFASGAVGIPVAPKKAIDPNDKPADPNPGGNGGGGGSDPGTDF